ncbi:hypothetical protein SAMN05421504_105362 [Amycolatopsis xylanica]|uniref:Uncharacterized protein n=1 Tax=Amycolatopsis xylanica TaxID=589385 RepID=A0A1H3JDH7_9PSEU|nr:hypothetical protein [Amycolatopsis xylanica]SDY38023.1 hypothetical protein SAMN05421504_105362 [Amycolatopsis xylanica]
MFGEGCVNEWRKTCFVDHGLVEFHWDRSASDRPWSGAHFSVQAHRLSLDDDYVNPVIQERYGRLGAPMSYVELAAELDKRGVVMEELPSSDSDMREFWQPDSYTVVYVTSGEYYCAGKLKVGDVYRVSSPYFASPESKQSAAYRHRSDA